MKEKKKLELKDLKVQSFVTELDTDKQNEIRGGETVSRVCSEYSLSPGCPSLCCQCDSNGCGTSDHVPPYCV